MDITKICITGPESTGKSTLAKNLSDYYQAPLVPEFAREYISKLDRKYQLEDLLVIAKEQVKSVETKTNEWLDLVSREENRSFVFCDTDVITIDIWMQDKFNNDNSLLKEMVSENLSDLYLLCYPDLKWDPDPQREDPDRQHLLFREYENYLDSLGVAFVIVKGDGMDRIKCAKEHISKFFPE